MYGGADVMELSSGSSEGGAKPSSRSLRQGVWGHSPPEGIGCWVIVLSKCKD